MGNNDAAESLAEEKRTDREGEQRHTDGNELTTPTRSKATSCIKASKKEGQGIVIANQQGDFSRPRRAAHGFGWVK